jgi:YHS domain-containing protein
MVRALAYLIASVLVISVVRSILGIVLKGFSDLFHPPEAAPKGPPRGTAGHAGQAVGELKKDPVCGTFISTSTSMQKRLGGETYYFCSAECRDKFKG